MSLIIKDILKIFDNEEGRRLIKRNIALKQAKDLIKNNKNRANREEVIAMPLDLSNQEKIDKLALTMWLHDHKCRTCGEINANEAYEIRKEFLGIKSEKRDF